MPVLHPPGPLKGTGPVRKSDCVPYYITQRLSARPWFRDSPTLVLKQETLLSSPITKNLDKYFPGLLFLTDKIKVHIFPVWLQT